MRAWCVLWFFYTCSVNGTYMARWCINERINLNELAFLVLNIACVGWLTFFIRQDDAEKLLNNQ